mgnify:CR=1 FL=1
MPTFLELLDEQNNTPGAEIVERHSARIEKEKAEQARKDADIADNMRSYWANLNNGSAGGVGSDE